MPDEVTPKEKRGRVVDHAKRLYSIVVGLAVAEACKRLFPFDAWNSTTFVLFGTFLFTIIPIFQGFDRSLDIKYYEVPLGETPTARNFIPVGRHDAADNLDIFLWNGAVDRDQQHPDPGNILLHNESHAFLRLCGARH